MISSDRIDRSGRKGVVGILLVLIIIIVALTMAIVARKFFESKPILAQLDFDEAAKYDELATEKCDELRRYYKSGVMDIEDADSLYEEYLNAEESNFYKVSLTTCYALLLYDKTKEIDVSIALVESIEPLIENQESQIRYYSTLMVLYNKAGNTEKSEYYKQILNDLTVGDEESEEEEEII